MSSFVYVERLNLYTAGELTHTHHVWCACVCVGVCVCLCVTFVLALTVFMAHCDFLWPCLVLRFAYSNV